MREQRFHFAKQFFPVVFATAVFAICMPVNSIGQPLITYQKEDRIGNHFADFKTAHAVKWKFHSGSPFMSSPVISGNTVYIGGLDRMLYAIDISTGKVSWKFRTGGETRSNVLVNKEQLFLVGGDGTFYTIEKNSGKLNWKWVQYHRGFFGRKKV